MRKLAYSRDSHICGTSPSQFLHDVTVCPVEAGLSDVPQMTAFLLYTNYTGFSHGKRVTEFPTMGRDTGNRSQGSRK